MRSQSGFSGMLLVLLLLTSAVEATPLPSTVQRVPNVTLSGMDTYYWIGDDQIVLLRSGQNGHFQAFRVNTATGAKAPLAPFESQARDLLSAGLPANPKELPLGAGEALMTFSPSLPPWHFPSPDGKKILSPRMHLAKDAYVVEWSAIDLESFGRRRWRLVISDSLESGSYFGGWMPDSASWVERVYRDSPATNLAVIKALDLGKPDRRVRLDRKSHGLSLGVLPGDRMILWQRVEPDDFTELGEVALGGSKAITRKYRIALPFRSVMFRPCLGSQGRIAWLLGDWPASRVPTKVAIWTSEVDGSSMRELLRLDLRPKGSKMPFEQVRWSPDGSKVSFIYDGGLYLINDWVEEPARAIGSLSNRLLLPISGAAVIVLGLGLSLLRFRLRRPIGSQPSQS